MALTVVSRPDEYSAAYLPMEYVFTSNLDPNSRGFERTDDSFLRGTSFSGEDVEVFIYDRPLPIVVGDFVFIENGGAYNGVHRVASIVTGLPGINVSAFTLDTPVSTEAFSSSYSATTLAASTVIRKYYNNYSALLDVYIENQFVVRLRKSRDFNDQFVFDISSIVQEYLGSDLLPLGTSTEQKAIDLSKNIHVQYAEEYDLVTDGIATTTIFPFTDDSANTIYPVNSTIPYIFMKDFSISSDTYSLADYYSNDIPFTSDPKFNWLVQTDNIRLGSNDSYQLSFINGNNLYGGLPISAFPSLDLVLNVITYDSQGAVIADTDVVLRNDSGTNLKDVFNVPVGPANLSAYITSDTVKYKVGMKTGIVNTTNYQTFIIEDECDRIQRRFEWVNKLGGLDAFTFRGKEKRDIDIEKQTFKRELNFPRVIPERQVTTFGVQSKDIYTVNSGIVNELEKEWLIDLLESPEVYLVVDGYRLPVQVNTKFGFERLAYDSYNVTMEYELAYDKIIQRN